MAIQMTTDAAIAQTYLFATGKTTALAGTTKYTKILALLNTYSQTWANKPGVNWESLRSVFAIGTVSATDTYTLPVTMDKYSDQEGDFVRIFHTDGVNESLYTVVPIERLYDSEMKTLHWDNRHCSISGSTLTFAHSFLTTDPQFGGTIKVPGYGIPATLAGGTSEFIAVDDPYWLCLMAAAEYVRNDITRVALRPSLIEQANELEQGMIERNDSQLEEVYSSWRPLGQTWA